MPVANAQIAKTLGRPIGANGDETRQRILEAALECFATSGYATASTRMIADQVGLSQPAVYKYFAKKRDLMVAVHRWTQDSFQERVSVALESETTFRGKLKALLAAINRTLTESPNQAVFASLAREEARRHPELAEITADNRFQKLFEELVEFGIATGEIAKEDAVEARGVAVILGTGLAFTAADVSPKTHTAFTQGCQRLIEGTLLRPPVR